MFSVHIIITYRYILEKYYTDHHDVDEDLRTIVDYGGGCTNGTSAGITRRNPYDSSSFTWDGVASKK